MPKTLGAPRPASSTATPPSAQRPAAAQRAAAQDAVERATRAPRIAIESVMPAVDSGRYPAKGICGQAIDIAATIFMDGHDQLAARVLWWTQANPEVHSLPLRPLGNDRWGASLVPSQAGLYRFTIEAWFDVWGTFACELRKKYQAALPLRLELLEGRALLRSFVDDSPCESEAIAEVLQRLEQADEAAAVALLLDEGLRRAVQELAPRAHLTRLDPPLQLEVERLRAGYASWYELFPRSETDSERRHGSFDDVIARLPAIREMGFDVLYFPPIHPIGHRNRKGRNNALVAEPGDPGSPYAIGSPVGGHEAVHPQLGGIEAFRRLRDAAQAQGLELALDFAVQCSPDHPWLSEHPDWFSWRPDGSIRYAENPPKRYEDIVNVDFYADGAVPQLWIALRDVVAYWVSEGVRMFRVDNPHTKPLPFWQWLIADIRGRHPDVMFLAEAFTRPAMMYRLAKIGFSQSYTYFTWRNSKAEIQEYLTELSTRAPSAFFRPHFFVNTPDINPYFLQTSGRAGFLIRAALAATLSGLWGMCAGFELCESAPVPGKEEYLDSDKYQIRVRHWRQPGNIVDEIAQLNRLRREHPALQTHLNLRFHRVDNDQILFFCKATPDREDVLLIAISLDPHHAQEAHFEIPLWEFGLPDDGELEVEERMGGGRFVWKGKRQHWYFDPRLPFAIWRVRPKAGVRA